jgi:hypothetical protein
MSTILRRCCAFPSWLNSEFPCGVCFLRVQSGEHCISKQSSCAYIGHHSHDASHGAAAAADATLQGPRLGEVFPDSFAPMCAWLLGVR